MFYVSQMISSKSCAVLALKWKKKKLFLRFTLGEFWVHTVGFMLEQR